MKKIITRQLSDVDLNASASSLLLPTVINDSDSGLVLPKKLALKAMPVVMPSIELDSQVLDISSEMQKILSPEAGSPRVIPEALGKSDFLIVRQLNMVDRLGISQDVSESSFNLSWSMIGLIVGATAIIAGGVFLLIMPSFSNSSSSKKKEEPEDQQKTESLASDDLFSTPDVSQDKASEADDENVDKVVDGESNAFGVEKIANSVPVSRNIEADIEGKSPYPIGKEGFFFRDDDGDPLRGLVITSLPDQGELKLGDDVLEEETFLKISSVADIDDLNLTYHLEEEESASSFDFVLVSGQSVVDQQESELYTYHFSLKETLAGPDIHTFIADSAYDSALYDYPPINYFS
ncbi:MAG: hypothetical protein OXE99_01775 [Cellvibrionales bacterium]|nr:hypothetical protein [Cellvibrionales bacterium]